LDRTVGPGIQVGVFHHLVISGANPAPSWVEQLALVYR
jgi:hypothetical protein